ncbi:zinc finger protein 692-like isoform X4 [Pyrgilauda ruficollis]|uniref:zinc finger protein 692-like isoform X4 n=1 Tax=Pyrgilauda ruficollis TaxID=221976 RepID=UPI001B876E0A|nr:zinc finger protein 692-like isoform X4 [Pyrgilauda ruficollis]
MESGAAQEPLAGGRPQPPECLRRQKRRELDARRSKCRIRIGGHLERWCRLKEQLGFALHSQLAQFLLDRYSSHGCSWSTGELEQLQPAALQRLVVLSHGHGQECGFVPDIQLPAPGSAAPLVWECVAGHRFSWGGSGGPKSPSCHPLKAAQGCSPSPGAGRRRSLRRATPEGTARSPRGDGDRGEDMGHGDTGGTAPQVPPEPEPVVAAGESSAIPGDDAEPGVEPREEEEEEEDEDFAKGDDLAYTDDLRDENYHPSLDRWDSCEGACSDSEPQRRQSQPKAHKKPVKDEQPLLEPPLPSSGPLEKSGRVSCRRQPRASDKDVAQIGPKRIRKAAKREILLCDFEGCGKIFSNRQYLNHHQKYQHVHQKTFTCSEPTCGKSFNFKKHLKEHEKLHSGEWGISMGITPPPLRITPPWTSSCRGYNSSVWIPVTGITPPLWITLPVRIPPAPVGFTPPVPPSPPIPKFPSLGAITVALCSQNLSFYHLHSHAGKSPCSQSTSRGP